MKILLVDDDKLVRKALSAALRRAGFEVIVASSYEEAVEIGKNSIKVDVVLTDYHLGNGKTGADVVRDACAGLPFILMSGRMPDVPYAFREQAADLLEKPVTVRELVSCLNQFGSERAIAGTAR